MAKSGTMMKTKMKTTTTMRAMTMTSMTMMTMRRRRRRRTMVTMMTMTSIIGLPREADQRQCLILQSCYTVPASRMSLAFWNLKNLIIRQLKQKMIVHQFVAVVALLLLKPLYVVDRWHMKGVMILKIPPIPSSDHTQRHSLSWSAQNHVDPCLLR